MGGHKYGGEKGTFWLTSLKNKLKNIQAENTVTPVSYTHLDVYKRQILNKVGETHPFLPNFLIYKSFIPMADNLSVYFLMAISQDWRSSC